MSMTDLSHSVNKSSASGAILAGTILVVDDCAGSRRVICTVLRAANFTCLEAEHGRAALDILKSAPVDLLVTDLQMPEMDGFALISALSSLPEDRRPRHVVVCSAMLGDGAVRRAELEEADACLSKSVSPLVLLRTVLGVLFGCDEAMAGAGRS